MRTYFNTKTGKFTEQATASKASSKIEITTMALEGGKVRSFTVNDGTVKGFTAVVGGVSFDVIELASQVVDPENKYKVYFPGYCYDAETICIND